MKISGVSLLWISSRLVEKHVVLYFATGPNRETISDSSNYAVLDHLVQMREDSAKTRIVSKSFVDEFLHRVACFLPSFEYREKYQFVQELVKNCRPITYSVKLHD